MSVAICLHRQIKPQKMWGSAQHWRPATRPHLEPPLMMIMVIPVSSIYIIAGLTAKSEARGYLWTGRLNTTFLCQVHTAQYYVTLCKRRASVIYSFHSSCEMVAD